MSVCVREGEGVCLCVWMCMCGRERDYECVGQSRKKFRLEKRRLDEAKNLRGGCLELYSVEDELVMTRWRERQNK